MRRLLLTIALLGSNLSNAFVLKTDSSGATLRWKHAVQFVVDSRISGIMGEPRAFDAIQSALDSWQAAASGLPLSLTTGRSRGLGFDHLGRNQNEIVALSEWPFDANAIAVTLVTIDTGSHEILDADIAFNVSSHLFRMVSPEGDSCDDIQNTITHEFGHALGLAHNRTDSGVVMYPSARLGEVSKRVLSGDDRAGIGELYPPGMALNTGCSSSAGEGTLVWFFLLLPVFILSRRRPASVAVPAERRSRSSPPAGCLLLLLLLPFQARSSEVEREEAPAQSAAVVATAEVVSAQDHPSENPRILITELQVAVRSCLKGACPARFTVLVVGGKRGRIEQFIEGEPVPQPGTLLGITVAPGLSLDGPTLKQTRVYRLETVRDFTAFARGLANAGLSATLPIPGSAAPSR
jgi:hypothetical protein